MDTVVKTCTCPKCHSEEVLVLDAKAYTAWQRGELIQRAFPSLTSAQRERLITGYCDPCWQAMFPEEED